MTIQIPELITMISMVLIMGISTVSGQSFKREAADMLAKANVEASGVVTDEDLEGLPESVQRYLRYTGVVGQPRIKTIRLKQQGAMRLAPDKSWLPMKATQYYATESPAFIWKGTIKAAPLFKITARDRYRGGRGNMQIRLMGLFKVVDMTEPELDQGTLVRFLSEGIWFPTVYLEDYITWEAIDSLSAKATMAYMETTASAMFYFNELGQVVDFVADRYMEKKGTFELRRWSTPLYEYREINGLMLPVTGEAIWELDDCDFSYIRVELLQIEYNVRSVY